MTRSSRARWSGRFRWFDHLVRARERYTAPQGDLLAAGVTYFAFLGLFPMLLLAVSLFGLVLSGHTHLEEQLIEAIQDTIPGPTGDQVVTQLKQAVEIAGVAGLVGLAGALYAGLRTVGKLRIGMQCLWKGQADPPRFLRDNLADLASLAVLGVLGLAGLVLTGAVSQELSRVQALLGLPDIAADGVVAWVLGIAVATAGDIVVFLWLLRMVSSVPYGLRELLPGAVFGAVGFEVLKLLGGWYLSLISNSLTAAAFGGAIGILVWINTVARFAFFTAAWTATGPALQRRDPAPHPPASVRTPVVARPPVAPAKNTAAGAARGPH